ncbi:MAG TPA: hypothetical protein VM657_02155 [Sphingomonas sp.]|nr:hypothetical protein [Sphingomonas sp.]
MSPDPRRDQQKSAPGDDQEDATNRGVSAEEPAEGADDTPPEQPGSQKG